MIYRVFGVFFVFLGVAQAENENRVTSFVLPEVEVCSEPDVISSCENIKRELLPNPKKNDLRVIEIDGNGMVGLKYENKLIYIHRTEVVLSVNPKVSVFCDREKKETSLNVNVYGMHGIMGDCDE